MRTTPTPSMTATRRIHIVNRTARSVLKGSNMRTSTTLLICSALAACAQVGERGGYEGPDAGSGSSTNRTCDDLQTVTGDLTITGTSGFTGLPESCWELTGKLTLRGPAITSLDKLGDLRTVASLELDSTALTRIDTPSTIDVTGDVAIHHNAQLTDIANLQPHGELSSLMVEYNDSLTTLGGLSEVTRVTGATMIDDNGKLATLDLSRAARLEGGLEIADNASLTIIKLDELTSVASLTLRHNTSLTSISSLASLQYIHGTLTIDDNDKLSGLDSMSGSMTSIDGGVSITNNALLSDLGQLTHVGVIGGSVSITSNSSLSYCQPQPFTCCVQMTGALTISGNAGTSCQQHSWCYDNNYGCPYNN
jgi:hypothetical protein